MVDVSTIQYRVVAVDSNKKKYNITDYVHDLSWEENEGEIASRISFTVKNDQTSEGYLSTIVKPGCMVRVSVKHGSEKYCEVVRGSVASWNITRQSSAHNFKCICYDGLYNLQKSQDEFYFRSGTSAKSRIRNVLKKWSVPVGTYRGPTKKQGKKKYQNAYLSDILIGILDDAEKKDGKKYMLRMEKNKAAVIPLGSNEDIYVFKSNNTRIAGNTRSTEDLITRVKVIGASNGEEPGSVSATLNGLTKYGIRQRIYTRGSDETLEDAKNAAAEILNENGNILEEASVQAPDVPYVRKGDIVYVKVGRLIGYFYVKGVRHDAASLSMTMELETAEKEPVAKSKNTAAVLYKTGDTVTFSGGKYFASANGQRSFSAKKGRAKITKKKDSGKHPFHLVHTDGKSGVCGWVDEGSFS